MSELENSTRHFLQRWSQRKRAAENHAPDDADLSPEDKKTATNAAAQSDANLPAFDPATLPPIESITATSDVRAFLAPGVPEELTRAALRRVWLTDPTIRDFIGVAENQWDFTKPDGVPGFGSLELTPELRRMVASLIADAPRPTTLRQENTGRVEQTAKIAEPLPPPVRTLESSEDDSTAERSSARTGTPYAGAAAPELVRVMPRDSNNESLKKSIGYSDVGPRSFPRKHGGAVPK
jgi:Protein of unknown function (DUF3306)